MIRSICIQTGPAVDAYLHTAGAVAQAFDSGTILAGSRMAAMSRAGQRAILFHELAHLEQLARPGQDSERDLEDEAWEAAGAWMSGRPFKIRGRARGPLNATALILAKAHPFAQAWYDSNPIEPIGNKSTITVDKVISIDNMTIESLLDKIIELKGTQEFVVVAHGNIDGLALPLMSGSTGGASKESMGFLEKDHADEDMSVGGTKVKMPAISTKRVSELTHLDEKQVLKLRDKMNQVKARKLKHIAFRACTIGATVEAMQAFFNFFGAASISAPGFYDTYGQFEASVGSGLDAWSTTKRKQGYHIWVDDKVAFGTKKVGKTNVYLIVSRAETKDVMTAWVTKHIADGYKGGDIVYHGIQSIGTITDKDQSVFFVRDAEFISNITFWAR